MTKLDNLGAEYSTACDYPTAIEMRLVEKIELLMR